MLHKFDTTEAVLAEMRTIRCIEHTGRMKFITPFIGPQVEICKVFGFDIPDGCAPCMCRNPSPRSENGDNSQNRKPRSRLISTKFCKTRKLQVLALFCPSLDTNALRYIIESAYLYECAIGFLLQP